jgi:DNA topoisomerase-1
VAAEREMERIQPPVELAGENCEKCGRPMLIKFGRYGKFIACSGFPDCRNTKPFVTQVGALCPECESPIVERRSRAKKRFYGCSRYPDCNWVSWSRPLVQPCPSCGGLLVESGRERARCVKCGNTYRTNQLESTGDGSEREAAQVGS